MILNQSLFKFSLLLFVLTIAFPAVSFSQTTIWEEDFSSYADGTIVGTGNKWTVTTTAGINYFEVVNQEFQAKDTDAKEQVFTTEQIDISSYSNVNLSVDASKFAGTMELAEDYVKVSYILDGGTETLVETNGENLGEFGNVTASQLGLSGSTIQIIIRVLNGTGNWEIYSFDNILVTGTQTQTEDFYDSDNDGILDNIDVDDDNDGILDTIEESDCKRSSVAKRTNYKYLNETFGTGTNRVEINEVNEGAQTTYGFKNSGDLGDGYYTVGTSAQIASWANDYWYKGGDHTGDTNGRMAIFNASFDPGLFYSATIKGALPNIPISYSFWVLNIDRTDAPGIATRLRPNILVEFRDASNTLLTSITTGDIAPTSASNLDGDWINFQADLVLNVDEFYVYFYNNETGGLGNDLAIDDIVISQTLCDTEGDGVANVFDLDSDNDGIPDAVEAGLGIYTYGEAKFPPAFWLDSDSDGHHDNAENTNPLDSDADGVPNYIDLDSDNDTVFDVDESGATNSNFALGYQNGDGDINGDGVGDGLDSDAVRETDIDGDGVLEYYTDGILDIYDATKLDFENDGATMDDSYGNLGQGIEWSLYVADSDLDGLPNYIDVNSNGGNDFDATIYKQIEPTIDTDFNGIIDGTTDTDGDGILDGFDTDNTVFGSPRDINNKLLLYFDGRNDYVEDAAILSGEASIMGWIKIEEAPNGTQRILGQNNFYIQINSSKKIAVVANGTSQEYNTAIELNRWVHIAATYGASDFKLYINGVELGNGISGGTLSADASPFTIGRISNIDSGYFKGYIDEVRVFSKALTENEFHKMVYQELENNGGVVKGTEIPLNIQDYSYDSASGIETSVDLSWSNLLRYFRMDTFKDDITDDLTTATVDVVSGAKMYNMKIIDVQTAPLPFVTQSGGTMASPKNLTTALNTSNGVNGEDAINSPASIVKIEHDFIYSDEDQSHIGLFLSSNMSYTLNGITDINNGTGTGNELNVSWYLSLNGVLDLNGESQLVQSMESVLDVSSSGYIERDQQGTANVYSYNYWGSPVGIINTTTNNSAYTLADVLYSGTSKVYFVGGYDGNDTTTPIQIANYWLFKYANLTGTYAEWQHVGSTGSIKAGEGFTMKGGGAGLIDTFQDYTFKGKPNNGTITLNVSANNIYLVANPYPSAIDAYKFISENGEDTLLTGTLYFWEQYKGTSHVLAQYEGGYGAMTQGGAVAAVIPAGISPNANASQSLKIPKQYIPVAQGFFVQSVDKTGVEIKFKNSQRAFVKESESVSGQPISVFMKSSNEKEVSTDEKNSKGDFRPKIRLGFEAPNVYHRQLLLTVDEKATDSVDWGYDGKVLGMLDDDMYWNISNEKYVIQVIPKITSNKEIPLVITMKETGAVLIQIDTLENVDENLKLYIKDNLTGTKHQINNEPFKTTLDAGSYFDRFSLTFKSGNNSEGGVTLIEEIIENINLSNKGIYVFMNNRSSKLIIRNRLQKTIKRVVLYNCLGQVEHSWTKNLTGTQISLPVAKRLRGLYLIRVKTTSGIVFKKVFIK
ncbi:LamG-like jellyroll fold domain-containing protein [Lutibacter holmesii]|uniref:LamG-like jellyroll fold domain-containing protein n=1 Tax=Lutibacter holmesii TaxID=1137985 RepID=A0ABW3WMF3_9FLAO